MNEIRIGKNNSKFSNEKELLIFKTNPFSFLFSLFFLSSFSLFFSLSSFSLFLSLFSLSLFSLFFSLSFFSLLFSFFFSFFSFFSLFISFFCFFSLFFFLFLFFNTVSQVLTLSAPMASHPRERKTATQVVKDANHLIKQYPFPDATSTQNLHFQENCTRQLHDIVYDFECFENASTSSYFAAAYGKFSLCSLKVASQTEIVQ